MRGEQLLLVLFFCAYGLLRRSSSGYDLPSPTEAGYAKAGGWMPLFLLPSPFFISSNSNPSRDRLIQSIPPNRSLNASLE